MKCPYVSNPDKIDKRFNEPLNYKDFGGAVDYTFFNHIDPFGKTRRVQFCELCGRKQDVFECLNESEWKNCPHYKIAKERKLK